MLSSWLVVLKGFCLTRARLFRAPGDIPEGGLARFVHWCARVSSASLLVAGLAERVAEPLKTLVKTVTGGSASGLDVLYKLSVCCVFEF